MGKKQDNISNDAIKNKMKYRISTVGKIKSNDEDIITRKYLQRIKNIELKQYEVKTKNKEKLEEEADKLINSTPKNGKLIFAR